MTFILRLPAILALLALLALSWSGAFAATVLLANLPVDLSTALSPGEIEAVRASTTWIDAGLWWAAGLCFLVAAIRLIRRTQGFWAWLLGFAAYGARWGLAQQNDGGLEQTLRSVDPNAYLDPTKLAADTTSATAQVGVLGVILIVGLLILIVDAADRAHWNRHEG